VAEERLQKVLAAAGYGSRRKCEELIASGRVKVNGRIARLGDKVDPRRDRIFLDGVPVDLRQDKKYFLLNKPPGYITTVKDPRGRPTVMDLIHEEGRLFPVGRLDKDTRGLLLITNDGYLAQKLTHPSHGVRKTYVVLAEGYPTPGALARLRGGVELEDGTTSPAEVRVKGRSGNRCLLEITIKEGRKRQVRRMCAAVGLKVLDLVRIRVGPLELKGVPEGSYRELTAGEVEKLLLET
jgi:pseudouridine synthase